MHKQRVVDSTLAQTTSEVDFISIETQTFSGEKKKSNVVAAHVLSIPQHYLWPMKRCPINLGSFGISRTSMKWEKHHGLSADFTTE